MKLRKIKRRQMWKSCHHIRLARRWIRIGGMSSANLLENKRLLRAAKGWSRL